MFERDHSPPRLIVDPPTPSSDMQFSPMSTTPSPTKLSPEPSDSQPAPSFHTILRFMRTRLCPLVSATTGLKHPDFPSTIFAYHLLTSEQLDNLARHFHQVSPPAAATYHYPMCIPAWIGSANEKVVDVATKRRRFGRFIGLRNCESPVEEDAGGDVWMRDETEEEMVERMEREWQESLARARQEDSDAAIRWKAGGC